MKKNHSNFASHRQRMKTPENYNWLCPRIQSDKIKSSRGEICVANLKPPGNGSSLGCYLETKNDFLILPSSLSCGYPHLFDPSFGFYFDTSDCLLLV